MQLLVLDRLIFETRDGCETVIVSEVLCSSINLCFSVMMEVYMLIRLVLDIYILYMVAFLVSLPEAIVPSSWQKNIHTELEEAEFSLPFHCFHVNVL